MDSKNRKKDNRDRMNAITMIIYLCKYCESCIDWSWSINRVGFFVFDSIHHGSFVVSISAARVFGDSLLHQSRPFRLLSLHPPPYICLPELFESCFLPLFGKNAQICYHCKFSPHSSSHSQKISPFLSVRVLGWQGAPISYEQIHPEQWYLVEFLIMR